MARTRNFVSRRPVAPDFFHQVDPSVNCTARHIEAPGDLGDVVSFGDQFDEPDQIKRDVIAVRQLHALKDLQGPREKPLRLSDVKKMFAEMRDHLGRSR